MKRVICFVTKREFDEKECYRAGLLRGQLLDFISTRHPGITSDDYISIDALTALRKDYLLELINQESGKLDQLGMDVVQSIADNKILSANIEPAIEKQLSYGQRVADHIAEFGGSWTFIGTFFAMLLLWMAINIWVLATRAFDPYPFILLNLILSCLAAIQAPIIMMSQNRQEQKDRLRGENDFKVDLKAELEIKLLHEKVDHLITTQHQRLLEIQEIQTEYLDTILALLRDRPQQSAED